MVQGSGGFSEDLESGSAVAGCDVRDIRWIRATVVVESERMLKGLDTGDLGCAREKVIGVRYYVWVIFIVLRRFDQCLNDSFHDNLLRWDRSLVEDNMVKISCCLT